MKPFAGLKQWRIPLFLVGIVALTLFILACGAEATPTPTPRPTAPPTPRPAATATPTVAPQATATPIATATPTPQAAKVPVSPRLIVSVAAPALQITMHYQSFQSTGGILRPMYEYMVGRDIKTSEEVPTHLATAWSVSPNGKDWTFDIRKGMPFYQNGKPTKYSFSAKDVRHTWEIMAGLKNKVSIP